jgi:hypothetical protein
MKTLRYIGLAGVALAVFALALSAGPSKDPAGLRLASPAEAVVGRPLTPVSVAGVARRTARRCAVGVYNC